MAAKREHLKIIQHRDHKNYWAVHRVENGNKTEIPELRIHWTEGLVKNPVEVDFGMTGLCLSIQDVRDLVEFLELLAKKAPHLRKTVKEWVPKDAQ
jgi:hypothetical protein